MDPTTADFNAWLAEEGAKIGATVPPQPSNLLAMYGTGYVPADTAYEPTTADILAQAQRGTAIGNWLRSMAPEVRQADDSSVASGILSRLARTGTGMVHSGLNTAANWLEKRPEIGPDTLAPLGLAPMGSLVGHSASLAKPSVADSARARYLEWKHPDEISGGRGITTSAADAGIDPLRVEGMRPAGQGAASPEDYAMKRPTFIEVVWPALVIGVIGIGLGGYGLLIEFWLLR